MLSTTPPAPWLDSEGVFAGGWVTSYLAIPGQFITGADTAKGVRCYLRVCRLNPNGASFNFLSTNGNSRKLRGGCERHVIVGWREGAAPSSREYLPGLTDYGTTERGALDWTTYSAKVTWQPSHTTC